MGRMHPTTCEHGNVIDAGSFEGLTVGCEECDKAREWRAQKAFDDQMDLMRLRKIANDLSDATGEPDWEAAAEAAIAAVRRNA